MKQIWNEKNKTGILLYTVERKKKLWRITSQIISICAFYLSFSTFSSFDFVFFSFSLRKCIYFICIDWALIQTCKYWLWAKKNWKMNTVFIIQCYLCEENKNSLCKWCIGDTKGYEFTITLSERRYEISRIFLIWHMFAPKQFLALHAHKGNIIIYFFSWKKWNDKRKKTNFSDKQWHVHILNTFSTNASYFNGEKLVQFYIICK